MSLTIVIQVAAFLLLAIYLCYRLIVSRRRNGRSWESIIARLNTGWSGRPLSEHFLWREGLSSTPDETWEHIYGVRGLWAMFSNAGVMLEMAEYAACCGNSVDPVLLQILRTDAMQIRFCTLITMAQYLMSHASEGVRYSAFRAASMYTGMSAHTAQLLQDSAGPVLPLFVAAM
jgi:hypothetical protein